MRRVTLSVFTLLFSCFLQAQQVNELYQIDVIIFSFQEPSLSPTTTLNATLAQPPSNAIYLPTDRDKNLTPYHLLPITASQLREEYWALHRKPQYRVLMNYSWLQPFNNQKTIVLPKITHEGWQLEGSFRVERTNYYLLDTQLLLTNDDFHQIPFVFAQKQRLKGGEIYYFDHPQAGMIIKIHQLT